MQRLKKKSNTNRLLSPLVDYPSNSHRRFTVGHICKLSALLSSSDHHTFAPLTKHLHVHEQSQSQCCQTCKTTLAASPATRSPWWSNHPHIKSQSRSELELWGLPKLRYPLRLASLCLLLVLIDPWQQLPNTSTIPLFTNLNLTLAKFDLKVYPFSGIHFVLTTKHSIQLLSAWLPSMIR